MFKFKNSYAILLLILSGCAIFDFTTLEVRTEPGDSGAVVPFGSPIRVIFSEVVDRRIAEPLITLTENGSALTVDYVWEGPMLSLVPTPALVRGRVYTLVLDGDFATPNGKFLSVQKRVTFFAETSEAAPIITSFTPGAEAIVLPDQQITFNFSKPMDRISVERFLTLSPSKTLTYTWTNDTQVIITPQTPWTTGATYTWNLSREAKDLSGIGLAYQESHRFLILQDTVPPVINSMLPVTSNGAQFNVVGVLADLAHRDSLLIRFSELVDPANFPSAITLLPNVPGTWFPVTTSDDVLFTIGAAPSADYIYHISGRWGFGKTYTLTITNQFKDANGVTVPIPVVQSFQANIPTQSVTFQTIGPPSGILSPGSYTHITSVDETIELRFDFAEGYTVPYRKALEDSIVFTRIFPSGTSPVLAVITWVSGNQLTLSFTGLPRQTTPETVLYKVIITGGSGTQNQDGAVLSETLTWFLELES